MAYAAWSVVAGEQPTAAKWNILGTNDASFNDGSGLAFTTNNVVPGNALATSAITLGYAEITAVFNTASTAYVDVTGLSVTVTVPAGGRRILIMGFCRRISGSGGTQATHIAINEGATQLADALASQSGANNVQPTVFASKVASAGSHTYKIQAQQEAAGTMTFDAAATYPAFILVMAI